MTARIDAPPTVPTVALGAAETTLEDLARVARLHCRVELRAAADHAVARGHTALERRGEPLYGVDTGVGALSGRAIGPADNARHQAAILRSHAAGVGPPMRADEVRAMMMARLVGLASGHSAASPELVAALTAALNTGFVPLVPTRGSVGAADLAPLAHVGVALMGEGSALRGETRLGAAQALADCGLQPWRPTGRDALALIDGLSQTVGLGALAAQDGARLISNAEVAAATSMRALGSRLDALAPGLTDLKPHRGARGCAARLRWLLRGAPSRPATREPLSTRCAHWILGAADDAMTSARAVLELELGAVADNPAVATDGTWLPGAANFDGTRLAQALEAATTALIPIAVAAERRTHRVLTADHLPEFLAQPHPTPGLNSGLMAAHYTATALVAELRTLAVPASIQSIAACAGTEDYASMSPLAARRLAKVVALVRTVVAIELMSATRAIELSDQPMLPGLAAPLNQVRHAMPPTTQDRPPATDIAALEKLLASEPLA